MTISLEDSCHCDDPRWQFVLTIFNAQTGQGEVVNTQTIDCSGPDVEALAEAAGKKQFDLAEQAEADGKVWRLELACPGCGKGDMVTNAKRVLHVLAPHDGRDEPKIETMCGHVCMASPPTISLMTQVEHDHITVCLPCFDQDREAWK